MLLLRRVERTAQKKFFAENKTPSVAYTALGALYSPDASGYRGYLILDLTGYSNPS